MTAVYNKKRILVEKLIVLATDRDNCIEKRI